MILDKVIIVVCCLAAAAYGEPNGENTEGLRKARNVFLPPYYNNGQYHNYYDNRYHHPYHPYTHHSRIPFTGAVNPNDYRSPVLYSNDVRHPDGSYFYEFETANGIRRLENSVQTPYENVVQGSYSHVGPDGRQYTVNYIADKNGYRAFGDHLPQQPQQNGHAVPAPLLSHPIVVTTPKPITADHNKVIVTPVKQPVIAATAFPPFNYHHPGYVHHPHNVYVSPYNPYSTPRPYLAHPFIAGKK